MKTRVRPFGIGKAFITIEMDELPEDIRDDLIRLFSKRRQCAITEDTKEIVICGDVFPPNNK